MWYDGSAFWRWQLGQLPLYLCLLLSGLLCVVNYRRNPRGATLFGIACLLMAARAVLEAFEPKFFESLAAALRVLNITDYSLGTNILYSMLTGGAWILAALAVFLPPRRTDSGPFEDGA